MTRSNKVAISCLGLIFLGTGAFVLYLRNAQMAFVCKRCEIAVEGYLTTFERATPSNSKELWSDLLKTMTVREALEAHERALAKAAPAFPEQSEGEKQLKRIINTDEFCRAASAALVKFESQPHYMLVHFKHANGHRKVIAIRGASPMFLDCK